MKIQHKNTLHVYPNEYSQAVRGTLLYDGKGDIVTAHEKFSPMDSLLGVAEFVKSIVPVTNTEIRIVGESNRSIIVTWGEGAVFVRKDIDDDEFSPSPKAYKSIMKESPFLSSNNVVTIEVMAQPKLTKVILSDLRSHYGPFRQSQLRLWYNTTQGQRSTYLTIDKVGEHYPDLYPWIDPGYFDRYLASDAMILLIAGDPGTGKTSYLRHEIVSRSLSVTATYDEEVLSGDTMFIEFVNSSEDSIMIIEDADDILQSREKTKNNLIPRFLNFSEGLAKFPDKKIIFTTNLRDFSGIDEALIRKGRCFGSVTARAMTALEVSAAAKVLGIADPGYSCTLAELTNPSGGVQIKRNLALI